MVGLNASISHRCFTSLNLFGSPVDILLGIPIRGTLVRFIAMIMFCVTASGCMQRLVEAPTPVDDGSFYVHVVRQSDETFPKILTWYTGTTLSGSLVARFNPYLQERDVKVGDRIVIPLELIANDQPYGTAPAFTQKEATNLLMEGKGAAPQKKQPLETFDDDTNPMVGETPAPRVSGNQSAEQRRKELEQEIQDRQAELDRLRQPAPSVQRDADEENPYEGGESF